MRGFARRWREIRYEVGGCDAQRTAHTLWEPGVPWRRRRWITENENLGIMCMNFYDAYQTWEQATSEVIHDPRKPSWQSNHVRARGRIRLDSNIWSACDYGQREEAEGIKGKLKLTGSRELKLNPLFVALEGKKRPPMNILLAGQHLTQGLIRRTLATAGFSQRQTDLPHRPDGPTTLTIPSCVCGSPPDKVGRVLVGRLILFCPVWYRFIDYIISCRPNAKVECDGTVRVN